MNIKANEVYRITENVFQLVFCIGMQWLYIIIPFLCMYENLACCLSQYKLSAATPVPEHVMHRWRNRRTMSPSAPTIGTCDVSHSYLRGGLWRSVLLFGLQGRLIRMEFT
jgi:hypothetical protein